MSRTLRATTALLGFVLLLGQGAAVHHDHAAHADCPPEVCSHLEAAVHDAHDSGARWVESNDCLLCDFLAQGRTVATSAPVSVGARDADAALFASAPAERRPRRAPDGVRSRAPPSA